MPIDPIQRLWQQLLCTNWSTTSSCFDSFNKKMTAKVSAAEPSRKSSRAFFIQILLTFYSLKKSGKNTKEDGHDPYEISLTIGILAYHDLHSCRNTSTFQFESVHPRLSSCQQKLQRSWCTITGHMMQVGQQCSIRRTSFDTELRKATVYIVQHVKHYPVKVPDRSKGFFYVPSTLQW